MDKIALSLVLRTIEQWTVFPLKTATGPSFGDQPVVQIPQVIDEIYLFAFLTLRPSRASLALGKRAVFTSKSPSSRRGPGSRKSTVSPASCGMTPDWIGSTFRS
ncbi:hypothetical protein [Shinella granuli]|uniref:hypothetical protein n=1 Tax=Shinella granuli TaxID=323621 RepID=UPI001054E011|nr:hypothetical protein [Shinella granuli]